MRSRFAAGALLTVASLSNVNSLSAETFAARVGMNGFTSTVKVQTPGSPLFVATNPSGNTGDLSLLRGADTEVGGGIPFPQASGVIIAAPNQFQYAEVGDRNMVETPGELSHAIPTGFPQGMWLSTTKAADGGSEANCDFAFAHFPFADGWKAGHINGADGTFLAGNSTNVTVTTQFMTPDAAFGNGHYSLSIAGVNAGTDGMLFAQGTVNSGSGNVVPVGILPDNSGWDIRVNDEGNNFPSTEQANWSFVYVPYNANNLVAGGNLGIDDATSVVVRHGVGNFSVERVDYGPDGSIIPPGGTPDGINDDGRILIKIQDKTDMTGYLMVGVSKYATAGGFSGADDNFLTWEYNATLGGFLVESYDLTGAPLQNSDIYFAYFDYANPLSLTTPPHAGDFDGDGDVDGADFVAWQTNFPKASGATLSEGDADGDGDVDGADFVVWQTNFPFTPAPGTSPVPEPQALLLAFLAVPVFVAALRRRG